MKKSLIAALGLSLISTSAFATKARMQALGQDSVHGSAYIQDERLTVDNPAYFNTYKNYVVTEWGTDESAYDGSATGDGANTRATPATLNEGGFATEVGNMVLGVFLGRDNGYSRNTNSALLGASTEFLNDNNRLDVSLAGSAASFDWGVGLYRSSQEKETAGNSTAAFNYTRDGETMGLKLGAIVNHLSVSLNWGLKDEANGVDSVAADTTAKTDAYKGKTDMKLAAAYDWNDWSFFGDYYKYEFEATDSSLASNKTGTSDESRITLGAGRVQKINQNANLFYDLSFVKDGIERKAVNATKASEDNETHLNLNVAFEARANTWLTLRGSVNQSVLKDEEDITADTAAVTTNKSGNGVTAVSGGASLHFGELTVDGTVSQESGKYALGDNTLAKVGLTYMF